MSDHERFQLTESDLHPHLKARMSQRGMTLDEIQRTLDEGWESLDTKPGTLGKTMVLDYQATWESTYYDEKEVTVYYKIVETNSPYAE